MESGFACVSAALAIKVEDCYTEGRRAWFLLHEKGGIPCPGPDLLTGRDGRRRAPVEI